MRKLGKLAGVCSAVLIVALVTLVVLARVFITPERVKLALTPLASEALHREVQIGEVELSPLSGIALKNLRVISRQSNQPFISAEKVVLRYQLLPLLSRKVVIDEVRLESPRIRVARLSNGSWDIADLLGSRKRDQPNGDLLPEKDHAQPLLNLMVSKIIITDGETLLLDYQNNARSPRQFRFSDLTATARNIASDQDIPFQIQTRLNGASLDLEGEINLKSQIGSYRLKAANLDMAAFSPYVKKTVPGLHAGFKADLDLQAQTTANIFAARGTLSAKGVDLRLKAPQNSPPRKDTLSLNYDIATDLGTSVIQIRSAQAVLNQTRVTFSGRMENMAGRASLDLVMDIPKQSVQSLLAIAPDSLAAPLSGLNPAGSVGGRFHLVGLASDPQHLLKDGEARLDGLTATTGGFRPVVSGQLSIRGDTATGQGLHVKLGDNLARINLQADNLYGSPRVIASQIACEHLDLDSLLRTAAGDSRAAGRSIEPGPFNLPIQMEGQITATKATYRGLAFDDLEMNYRLADSVLSVSQLTGKVADGAFSQRARIDLRKQGLAWFTSLKLQNVQAAPILAAFAPRAAGMLYGPLDLDLEISGRGILPHRVKETAYGKGTFQLSRGKLTGAGMVQEFAEYLGLDELRVMHIADAQGDFTLQNGQVSLRSSFGGRDVQMAPRGTIGLDGGLDLTLSTRLSPQLSRKMARSGTFAGYLTDAGGWANLPVWAKGTHLSPRFALEASALKYMARDSAREKRLEDFREKVFGLDDAKLEQVRASSFPKGPPEDEGPSTRLFESTLNGLLN